LYVAGDEKSSCFQPITQELVTAFASPLRCKGLNDYPEVKGPPVAKCTYALPSIGEYQFNSPSLMNIPKNEITRSPIAVAKPDLFGKKSAWLPTNMSVEAMQKALVKKYHDIGEFDNDTMKTAYKFVLQRYKLVIKDCHSHFDPSEYWSCGVEGMNTYGTLAQVAFDTSPGLPWTAFRPQGEKGKAYLFDVNNTGKTEYPKILQDKVNEVLELWGEGIAYPALFNGSLKVEKRPIDRVLQKKTRIFTASPIEKVMCDRMLFADFVTQFKANRPTLNHCYGINPASMEWNDLAYYHREMGTRHVGFDYSGYDASLSNPLLTLVYDLVAEFYPDSKDKLAIDCSSVEARNHFLFAMGDVYHCHQGNPSGQMMTTVANCIANHLLITYAWIKAAHLCGKPNMATYTAWTQHLALTVYGDDFIYTVSPDAEYFDGLMLAEILAPVGVELTATDKSDKLERWIPFSQLTLLKRSFLPNPHGGATTVYVGPLDKGVVEEIPRWIWKTTKDDDFKSTIRSALQSAAAWGRDYYNWYVSELRGVGAAVPFLKEIPIEQIYDDVSSLYVTRRVATSQPIRAFFYSNTNLRLNNFMSNMFPCTVEYDGRKFVSVEHAYIYAKAIHIEDANLALTCLSNIDGRHLKSKYSPKFPSDASARKWDALKVGVMRELITSKFNAQNLKKMLLETGDSLLAEANPRDTFWGMGMPYTDLSVVSSPSQITGKNVLGQLLMTLRAELSCD